MDYPTPTNRQWQRPEVTRQQDRAALRGRANRVLLGFVGRAISRADRRLVARAYAAGAYRLSQSLPALKDGHYSSSHGKPVILNEAMLAWIAFGDKKPADTTVQEAQQCVLPDPPAHDLCSNPRCNLDGACQNEQDCLVKPEAQDGQA